MKITKPKLLITSLILPQLAGLAGSVFTAPAIDSWYSQLNRPVIAPPNWLFAPVWTLLFVLMGISLYLLKLSRPKKASQALKYFYIQLGLNFLWSLFFFGLKMPWLAFVEIIILWYYIFQTIKSSYSVKPLAGYLLVPYLLWVSFASILNFSFAYINF